MNKKINPSIIAIAVVMCTGLLTKPAEAQTHPKKKVSKSTVLPKKPTAADLDQGKALISKSDCLSCHKLDIKLVGPAYKDVAAKYPATEANYNALTKKVIAGGSGVWGQVAMSAHPTLPPADVRKMIQYILSVK